MKINELFKINRKLYLTPVSKNRFYTTTIQDIRKHVIYVAVPTRKGMPINVLKGGQLEIQFITEQALFVFITTVLGFKLSDKIPLMMLEMPSKVTRQQRRQYYRCPSLLNMMFSVMQDKTGVSCLDEKCWISAKVLDLSGGGIRFKSPINLSKGKMLNIKVALGSNDDINDNYIAALGEVVRITAPVSKDSSNYIYGLTFVQIDEKQRDRIINYIFTISRERVL